MNEYKINTDIISTTGITIDSRNISMSTGKVVINNVEVTDIDSWNKAINTFSELENKINNLQSKIDKAIECIEENILDNKIDNVDWDFDDCYYSDMPVARIKPLIDILKEDK